MGNFTSTSWNACCYPESNEFIINLSRIRAQLPFQFQSLYGAFNFPFNLGHQTLSVGSFLDLARKDIPAMARFEVNDERSQKIPANGLSRENVDRLAVGVSQPILKHDSGWRRVQRMETDIGTIIVEGRVVTDIVGILKLKIEQSTWIWKGGPKLIGTAEGYVEVYVRSRFEVESDRVETKLILVAGSAIVAIPVLLYGMLKYLTSSFDHDRLPPPSDPGEVPRSHATSAGKNASFDFEPSAPHHGGYTSNRL